MVAQDGFYVAAHFGSPAGELAVCLRAVGMGYRSNLVKHELRGEPAALERIVATLGGGRARPGRALHAAGAWWCAVSPDRVLVVCRPEKASTLTAPLTAAVAEEPEAQIADVTTDIAAIALLGPASRDVLGAVGVGDPPSQARYDVRFNPALIGGIPTQLLRESALRWIVLVRHALAEPLWHVLDQAGDPFGLGAVGAEAMDRYVVAARRVEAAALAG